MRFLYITTIGCTMSFFESLIPKMIKEGHTVDIACNNRESEVGKIYDDLGCNVYTIDCSRSPLNLGNIKAIKQIKEIVEKNAYDIVHCHTPIAAACTRIACRSLRKKGLKVFYTAHGFHFYKGAPKKNWIIYYPMEKICSYFTDMIITINKEDYKLSKEKMHSKKVAYVPGVGIDLKRFENVACDRKALRESLGIKDSDFVIISVGELNINKNQQIVIKAIAKLKNNNIHYILAGEGNQEVILKNLAKDLNIEKQVHLLGFRDDIPSLMYMSDVCVFPSIREGLGMAALEGMACGLPIIVSNNRGSRDYTTDNVNGFVCNYNDADAFANAINKLMSNPLLREKMGENNKQEVLNFEVSRINRIMKEVYGI